MERRLTEERGGGGLGRKEKTLTRNGGVEEEASFMKNGPILYFSRNDYLLLMVLRLFCRTVSSDLLKANSDLQFSRFEANPIL